MVNAFGKVRRKYQQGRSFKNAFNCEDMRYIKKLSKMTKEEYLEYCKELEEKYEEERKKEAEAKNNGKCRIKKYNW